MRSDYEIDVLKGGDWVPVATLRGFTLDEAKRYLSPNVRKQHHAEVIRLRRLGPVTRWLVAVDETEFYVVDTEEEAVSIAASAGIVDMIQSGRHLAKL